jgi:hypothetical protein
MSDPNDRTLDGKIILVLPNSLNFVLLHSLTVLGKDFSSNIFSQSFTNENHGKVKNRQT